MPPTTCVPAVIAPYWARGDKLAKPVAAGAAAAFAASQVALINSQQYQSAGGGGYDSGATAPSAPSQPAQFNIVGQGGANQLVEGIAGQFDRPIRAYVVSGEVISGAELDRRRIRTATFG
jgi:hypothetical protein